LPQRIDPRIKLRHLSCFLEVARLRSVVNAADALHVSQPAVSKTIAELEQLLGGSLFDRSKRNLFLTPFGEVFHRYASTSLAALRQGLAVARGAQEAITVRVGALPTVSARILPGAVAAFTANHPGVHTRITTGPNEYLLGLLRTGDVDFVIGRMAEPDAMAGLSFEHLYSERVVMVVRPGHKLLAEAAFDLSMIERYPILMPTPSSLIRRMVDRMLLAHGITDLRDEVETVSDAFGRAYLRQTDAVWIISEGVVANDLAEGRLALLPVDTSETTGPVGFTTRTDTEAGLSTNSLIQAVRDVAAAVG
jgi:LysR family pca operon transcriptional activator